MMQPTDIKDYACCTKEMAGNILQARVGAAVAVHKRLDYCDSGNRMRVVAAAAAGSGART